MSVVGTLAITFSAQTNISMAGQDNETGNVSTLVPQFAVPANSAFAAINAAFNGSTVQQVYLSSTANCTITTGNTNTADVQTFAITGTPTGGTFPVAWVNSNGSILATSVPFNANAATLQTALQLLVGSGNVNCNGAGAFPGNSINATFGGSLNAGPQPVFAVSNAAFTGGTAPNVTVTHAVSGLPSTSISLVAGIPRIWGASQGYGSNPFSGSVTGLYVSCNASALVNIGIISS